MTTTATTTRPRLSTAVAAPLGPTWQGLYRVGGLCLLGVGLIYLTNLTLGRVLGTPPADSQAYLQSLAGHATLARVTYGLYSLADFLLVPAALDLYLALRRVARVPMLLGAALLLVWAILDVVLTEFNALMLVTLSQHAAGAATDAARAGYLAAANYALATIPLATFYSWFVSSLAVLVVGLVMLCGRLGTVTAYLGIVAGVAGLIGAFYVVVPGLTILLNPTLLVFGVWLVLMGRRLYRLSAGEAQEPEAA